MGKQQVEEDNAMAEGAEGSSEWRCGGGEAAQRGPVGGEEGQGPGKSPYQRWSASVSVAPCCRV